eukprot:scaffold2729_cov403-Prasinococcus_capsulatus_cf.AAC.2
MGSERCSYCRGVQAPRLLLTWAVGPATQRGSHGSGCRRSETPKLIMQRGAVQPPSRKPYGKYVVRARSGGLGLLVEDEGEEDAAAGSARERRCTGCGMHPTRCLPATQGADQYCRRRPRPRSRRGGAALPTHICGRAATSLMMMMMCGAAVAARSAPAARRRGALPRVRGIDGGPVERCDICCTSLGPREGAPDGRPGGSDHSLTWDG